MLLNHKEVTELTGRARKSDQRVALTEMGIPYRIRPDGTPAVLRAAVDAWGADKAQNDSPGTQEAEPTLEESLQHLTPFLMGTTGHALLEDDQILNAAKPWKHESGIYFLIKDDRIVYVGQSTSIMRRIGEHIDKDFDSYSYISCPQEALDLVESIYIFLYRPLLNYHRLLGRFVTPMSLGSALDITSAYERNTSSTSEQTTDIME